MSLTEHQIQNSLQEGVLILDEKGEPRHAFRAVNVDEDENPRFQLYDKYDKLMTSVKFSKLATTKFIREYCESAGWKAMFGDVDELLHAYDNANEPDKNDVPYDGPYC